jgi:hypothetical protein
MTYTRSVNIRTEIWHACRKLLGAKWVLRQRRCVRFTDRYVGANNKAIRFSACVNSQI